MRHPCSLVCWSVLLWCTTTAHAQPGAQARPDYESHPQQNGAGNQEGPALGLIERLRAQLAQPGPEGADQRAVAIERLLTLPDEQAHAVLWSRLGEPDDPDGVRVAVLQALSRRLINPADPVFGEFEEALPQRAKLVAGYARTLSEFWRGKADTDGLLPPDALRDQARLCLVRMPVRDLALGLQAAAAASDLDVALRTAALRAAGDAQNLYFAQVLANFVADEDPQLRRAARIGLRYLTFSEQPFETKEQFDQWFAKYGNRRYLDLAEEAARLGARRSRQYREDMQRVLRESSSEVVRTLTERRNGIDWPAVQRRTLVDDVGTLRACLRELRVTLADRVWADDATARHPFARALLTRYRAAAADSDEPRALMLEVGAYLCRPNEVDVAAEIASELLVQLGSSDVEMQLAALRGLRRFPSPDARAAIVRLGQQALAQGENGDRVLSQALQTLSTTGDNPWRAPGDGAPDRVAWLELVRAVCTGPYPRERRNEALEVALMLDRDQKRVPEVFDLLLEIANDTAREPEYRTACLIRLQSWRDQPGRASMLVEAQARLLGDPERDVRLHAAGALTRLPDAPEKQKSVWLRTIVDTLQQRLKTETNSVVLGAMLDCLESASRAPGTPELAIQALADVLEPIGVPVPPDQQSRTESLLQALTTIAADPRAVPGQWLNACDMLLRHERRRQLRHVLVTHNAVQLAQDVRNPDARLADSARKAMRHLLLAALLKPAKESWSSTEDLRREASHVRIAFEAIPPGTRLPENLDEPRFRLLRLEVLLACDAPQEALLLANAWIETPDGQPFTPDDLDKLHLLVAEAHLQTGKFGPAADSLARISAAHADDPRALALMDRLGQAFRPTDAPQAVRWLERALKATAEEDPAFRPRLVALWQARVQANPADRDAVLSEIDQRSALFESPDCPEALREKIAVLRGTKNGG